MKSTVFQDNNVSQFQFVSSVEDQKQDYQTVLGGCPRGVMVKVMDCGIVVSKFVVTLLRSLSGKYPWERYEPPYPPSHGLNSTTTVLLGEWLWHLITYKGLYAIKPNQTKQILLSKSQKGRKALRPANRSIKEQSSLKPKS